LLPTSYVTSSLSTPFYFSDKAGTLFPHPHLSEAPVQLDESAIWLFDLQLYFLISVSPTDSSASNITLMYMSRVSTFS
jgi:hypothetical protein